MIAEDQIAAVNDFTVPFDIRRIPMPEKAIKQRVSLFAVNHSEGYSDWYIGTSEDTETALFEEHLVDRENGFYRALTTEGEKSTRKILKYYSGKGMECDFDLENVFDRIYVYRMENGTRP